MQKVPIKAYKMSFRAQDMVWLINNKITIRKDKRTITKVVLILFWICGIQLWNYYQSNSIKIFKTFQSETFKILSSLSLHNSLKIR